MTGFRIPKNVPLVFAALTVSFIIWVMAKLGDLETDRLIVRIDIEGVPENVEFQLIPDRMPIIVKFPNSLRSRVVSQNFRIRIDGKELIGPDPRNSWVGKDGPADKSIDVTLDNVFPIDLPQSVQVTELGPPSRFRMEARLRTIVADVEVEARGKLPSRYELMEEIRLDPSRVRLTGSQEAIQRIREEGGKVKTRPVDLTGRDSDFVAYPFLRIPEGLMLIDEDERTVEVFVSITEKEMTKTIAEVPIEIFVLTEGLRAEVSPRTARITVRGKISLLDRIDDASFKFAPRSALLEEVGPARRIELLVEFDEEVPRELREAIEIEHFTPSEGEIRFRVDEEAPSGSL